MLLPCSSSPAGPLLPVCPCCLQSGLIARGFEVLRLNTYDTLPVTGLDLQLLEAAKAAAVVTVGSPSAIK